MIAGPAQAHRRDRALRTLLVIFINQIREKIGVMFGSPETTTGGARSSSTRSIRLGHPRGWTPSSTGTESVGVRTRGQGGEEQARGAVPRGRVRRDVRRRHLRAGRRARPRGGAGDRRGRAARGSRTATSRIEARAGTTPGSSSRRTRRCWPRWRRRCATPSVTETRRERGLTVRLTSPLGTIPVTAFRRASPAGPSRRSTPVERGPVTLGLLAGSPGRARTSPAAFAAAARRPTWRTAVVAELEARGYVDDRRLRRRVGGVPGPGAFAPSASVSERSCGSRRGAPPRGSRDRRRVRGYERAGPGAACRRAASWRPSRTPRPTSEVARRLHDYLRRRGYPGDVVRQGAPDALSRHRPRGAVEA